MKDLVPALLLLSFFVFFSCGEDDSCPLTPPNWLIGNWEEPNSGILGYEVTNSTVIQETSFAGIDICQRYISENEQEGTSAGIEIFERSSNLYSFKLTSKIEVAGITQSLEYTFEKIDDDRIRVCENRAPCPSGALVYVRQ